MVAGSPASLEMIAGGSRQAREVSPRREVPAAAVGAGRPAPVSTGRGRGAKQARGVGRGGRGAKPPQKPPPAHPPPSRKVVLAADSGDESETGVSAFKIAKARNPRLEGETRKDYNNRLYRAVRGETT